MINLITLFLKSKLVHTKTYLENNSCWRENDGNKKIDERTWKRGVREKGGRRYIMKDPTPYRI